MSPDVAASVRARLLGKAKAAGEEFERTLTRFACERLLFRIGASPMRDRCLLKGASLLSVWLPDPHRATRNVDLLAFGPSDDGAIRAFLESACSAPCPEDGLRFDLSTLRIEPIRADEYLGKRARFQAFLGSARIAVQVDFGFGDDPGAGTGDVQFPTMLERLPPARVRAYTREAIVAEKFEATVKLDAQNSRMKDFHDIWALQASFAFDGARLRDSVVKCFARRATAWTDSAPPVLTTGFYRLPELEARWRSYLAAGGVLVRPPAQFDVIGETIIAFLGPVRRSIVDDSGFAREWAPGATWR